MMKFYIDKNGKYLGGFDGAPKPAGATEVPAPPDHAAQIYANGAWGPIPDDVTARQQLTESDRDMLRVAEDIFAALKAKGLLVDADLPQVTQDKLAARKQAREKL